MRVYTQSHNSEGLNKMSSVNEQTNPQENNSTQELLLEVKNVKKYFPIHSGLFLRHTGDVKALDGVTLSIQKGKTLGLVGESGCGKSTLGKTIIRLYDATEGDVYFRGQDFSHLKGQGLREMRQGMQMIFQDPFASLDPRMTVSQIVQEPLDVHNLGNAEEKKERVIELLKKVGLKTMHLNRYPHEFSGGQRQRIGIARCLATNPELIIADEPVSALDVSIQAQILNLMKDLQDELGLTYLFISHDLSVIEHMCDEIAVMYLGKIVEFAPRDELFSNPKHPYTKALIETIPIPGRGKRAHRKLLEGDVPSPINVPSGCPFHPRCPIAEDKCKTDIPVLEDMNTSQNHQASCWLAEKEG